MTADHIVADVKRMKDETASYEAETLRQMEASWQKVPPPVAETTKEVQRLTVAMQDFGRVNQSAWESMQAGAELMKGYQNAGIFVGMQGGAMTGYQAQQRARITSEVPTGGNTLERERQQHRSAATSRKSWSTRCGATGCGSSAVASARPRLRPAERRAAQCLPAELLRAADVRDHRRRRPLAERPHRGRRGRARAERCARHRAACACTGSCRWPGRPFALYDGDTSTELQLFGGRILETTVLYESQQAERRL